MLRYLASIAFFAMVCAAPSFGMGWFARCWRQLVTLGASDGRYAGTRWDHFANGRSPGRANLTRPFAHYYSQVLPFDHLLTAQGTSHEHMYNVQIQTLVYRGGTKEPVEFWQAEDETFIHRPKLPKDPAAWAKEEVDRALDRIYAEYAKQGPSRANEIPTYRAEDARNAHRTTHFLTGKENEVSSHLQVLLSSSLDEPLNLESHFGMLDRKPGELWAELGRLDIQQFEALKAVDNLGERDPKPWIRLQTWQQVYSYLAWDVKPAGVSFQVNARVLDILDHQKFLVFDRRKVKTKYGEEWILTQTPEQVRRTEDNLVREKWIGTLKNLVNEHPNVDLRVMLLRNERAAAERLGILRSVDGIEPKDQDGKERNMLNLFSPGHSQYYMKDWPHTHGWPLHKHWPGAVFSPEGGDAFTPVSAPTKALYGRDNMLVYLQPDYARKLLDRLLEDQKKNAP